jgi:glutamate racemase
MDMGDIMNKKNNAPIGIFDSGFGGLTVMSSIHKLLPKESLLYFGDTAHLPYGSKSKEAIIKFSRNIASYLVSQNIKMLVIACNTASAFALKSLRQDLKIDVLGVIEAGSKKAVNESSNKKIGIIGTQGTISSNSYKKEISRISKAKVYQAACPLFVPLVEEGWINTDITDNISKIYLQPLIDKGIDSLVLGCTHYPLLKESLQRNAKNIKLIDSADAVASQVAEILGKKNLLADKSNKSYLKFYASDDPKKFKTIGGSFFTSKINKVQKVCLD